ncbi:MAG: HTTM domain-containing protein, partial [Flavobacteriales bacterium]|nr:HTTM domain-containing protein [Flavobacteriales bacterium]
MMLKQINGFLTKPTHIAPLAVFRIVFGAVMFFSILRFMLNGWVHDLYVEPQLFFPYYGFEWIIPFSEPLMYVVFGGMAISFLFLTLGLFYRVASIFSFVAFTYVELIDKTNYLNHYYFVSIICFLLIFLPAHRFFSLDVKRKPQLERTHVPRYFIFIFQLQLAIVY